MPLNPPQDYRKTGSVHRIGLAANRPNAGDVLTGTLYFSTDTGVLARSNGSAWENYAPPAAQGVPAHHTTHEPGGTDALTIVDGGILLPSSVKDAALSANVALRNVNNSFSADQTFGGAVGVIGSISCNANLALAGGIYEASRSAAMGYFQDIPFNAANFSAVGGGTWTVDAAAVAANRYALVGKLMFWKIYVAWFQGTSAVAGTVTRLRLTAPVSFPGTDMDLPAFYVDPTSNLPSTVYISSGVGNYIDFIRRDGANFTPGTVGFICMMKFEIQ